MSTSPWVRCWVWYHKWTKWNKIGNLKSDGVVIGERYMRTCMVCGKPQTKDML